MAIYFSSSTVDEKLLEKRARTNISSYMGRNNICMCVCVVWLDKSNHFRFRYTKFTRALSEMRSDKPLGFVFVSLFSSVIVCGLRIFWNGQVLLENFSFHRKGPLFVRGFVFFLFLSFFFVMFWLVILAHSKSVFCKICNFVFSQSLKDEFLFSGLSVQKINHH